MSRFYYYLVFVNMVAHIVASVPAILLYFSKEGALPGMIVAVIAGVTLLIIYTKFFNSYPGKTLPVLLKATTPNWFRNPLLVLLAITWFVAGMITLITFSFLLIRFLTPDMPLHLITISILLYVSLGCLMHSERVLYTIDIVLLLVFPLIAFIIFKAYFSNHLEWDYIKQAMTYINQVPNFHAVSAATYLFLGQANLIIFNKYFTEKQNFKWRQVLFVAVIGTFMLFTTYFIPIGFNGFDHIESLVYPWITTSDSLRMKYGLIERVVFIFLLFFLAISFLSVLVHWHVSIELLKTVFNMERLKIKNRAVIPLLVVIIYSMISVYLALYLNEYQLYLYSNYFLDYLFIAFVFLIGVFWFIKRRLENGKKNIQ